MIKVKLKCDKHYNGVADNIIDAGVVEDGVLYKIIDKFTRNNELLITQEVVDYYNYNCSTSNHTSCKSANSIAVNCRKIIKLRNQLTQALTADTNTGKIRFKDFLDSLDCNELIVVIYNKQSFTLKNYDPVHSTAIICPRNNTVTNYSTSAIQLKDIKDKTIECIYTDYYHYNIAIHIVLNA